MNDLEMLLQRIQNNLGRELDEDEVAQVSLWHKGKSLALIVNTDGWKIATDTLKSYPDGSLQKLIETDPKSKDDVIAEHAVAFAAQRIYSDFIRAINDAVEAAQSTPEVVLRALRASPAPEAL